MLVLLGKVKTVFCYPGCLTRANKNGGNRNCLAPLSMELTCLSMQLTGLSMELKGCPRLAQVLRGLLDFNNEVGSRYTQHLCNSLLHKS